MFVIDGSASVGKTNFQEVKNWIKQVAAEFDMESGMAQIGVVQYSHWLSSL